MYKGANILTQGWDNSGDWILTLTAYFQADTGQGIVIKASDSTRRDHKEILIYNHSSKGLLITRYDPTGADDYVANSSQVTGAKTVTVTKTTTNGNTSYTVKVGSYTSQTLTHNSLTSADRVVVGNDYWSGDNSVYITGISVRPK